LCHPILSTYKKRLICSNFKDFTMLTEKISRELIQGAYLDAFVVGPTLFTQHYWLGHKNGAGLC